MTAPARHIKPSFGVPYASGEFRDSRFGVVCPACGGWFTSPDTSTEDTTTKGANHEYALHFVAAAEAEGDRSRFSSGAPRGGSGR